VDAMVPAPRLRPGATKPRIRERAALMVIENGAALLVMLKRFAGVIVEVSVVPPTVLRADWNATCKLEVVVQLPTGMVQVVVVVLFTVT